MAGFDECLNRHSCWYDTSIFSWGFFSLRHFDHLSEITLLSFLRFQDNSVWLKKALWPNWLDLLRSFQSSVNDRKTPDFQQTWFWDDHTDGRGCICKDENWGKLENLLNAWQQLTRTTATKQHRKAKKNNPVKFFLRGAAECWSRSKGRKRTMEERAHALTMTYVQARVV